MTCLKFISFVPHNLNCSRDGRTANMRTKINCGFGRLQEEGRFGNVGVRNFVGRRQIRTLIRCQKSGVSETEEEKRKMRILIAGGGIAGLVLALAAKKRGFDVKVFERDMSLVRGEGKQRGPIQLQSNALAVLEVIDEEASERIMEASCITGNRINGLVDGVSGCWYVKYDLFRPAAERGLPVTRVISRTALQDILVNAVGSNHIYNGCSVADFEYDSTKVTVILEDGRKFEGDVLVGADGIRSKVRERLFGCQAPNYSNYTCYSGIADFVPPDVRTVGYRVFLGHKQYFVSSDVGHGKMQWYAFHHQPAGTADPLTGMKKRLLELFGNWCYKVVDLLLATPETDIFRRNIYDMNMIPEWSKGCVTLVGDSAHAMQPNLGQGGCMAIEDSYQLVLELEKVNGVTRKDRYYTEIASALVRYERKRIPRVALVHAMSRMASRMVTDYQPSLVEALRPATFMSKHWIMQPFSVALQLFLCFWMNLLTYWILTGNGSELEERVKKCRLSDNSGPFSTPYVSIS